eukprot:6187681-Pleurochrysis_carterae.AAC.2
MDRGTRNFIVNGDFNAETEAWINRTGRIQKEEEVIFQGILEDLNLVTSVTEDYTFERAQTQIDNILVPIELIHNLKEAHVTTGVREKDHKLVIATLAWEMKGGKGESRPTRRHTDKFQEIHWLQYERILQERANMIQEKLGNKRPRDKLRRIHEELTKTAAEVAGEATEMKEAGEGEVDGYNHREEKELNKEEGLRERRRNQVFKWSRHLYHARRYTGGKRKEGGFWRRKEIRQDQIMHKLAKDDRRARRARVIEISEAGKERAEEQLRRLRKDMRKTTNTDALIQSLMSLGKGAGNVVIRVFDIIKKAGGNGDRAQRSIAGVYQDDDKGKSIIRGPEIREEVHKIATKINRADVVDVTTVREILHWLGKGEGGAIKKNRTDEIDRVCTKEKGKLALKRFQQHKGLGSDGFDGYLIRNAPQQLQNSYHEVVRDILIQEDYPTEWNEWIAVLMMKPGEDPFKLGRRRDIWLQCHSMKYVCRMLEAEYNEVADRHVPNTQARWTEDRMATEHSLTVRIVEERCELHRRPCIKGYVDMGSFFMSVNHAVQWEVEEAMGVSHTVIMIMKALREGTGGEYGGLTGRYETAYGTTEPVEIRKGLGQGDLLSPVRSKLILAIIQQTMQRLVPGIEFTTSADRGTPFLIYADDGIIMTDSVMFYN